MTVTLTRTRMRARWVVPVMLFASLRAISQLKKAPGFRKGRTLIQGRVFWTMTSWESREAMLSYRNSGSHRKYMPKLLVWADEAVTATFDGDRLPEWSEAQALLAKGKFMQLKRPSAAHTAKQSLAPSLPVRGALEIAKS